MNINLIDHRQVRQQRQKSLTVWRCAVAFILGLLLAWPLVWWSNHERRGWTLALQTAQAELTELQHRQAQWDEQTQAWSSWAGQHQTWLGVAHESQMPLRLWHWLNTGGAHGVRWTQWQQEGWRWTVVGEAQNLLAVRDWLVAGEYRPVPSDREVSVTQTEQREDGRIGFVLTWEELP
jgi:hypothetical protein